MSSYWVARLTLSVTIGLLFLYSPQPSFPNLPTALSLVPIVTLVPVLEPAVHIYTRLALTTIQLLPPPSTTLSTPKHHLATDSRQPFSASTATQNVSLTTTNHH